MINLNGLNIKLLGDAHLGKSFKNGVPLHRRGEREALVWKTFEESFENLENVDYHINMGDIFDRAFVPYDVIARAYSIYAKAQRKYEYTHFVVLQGNHDKSKDMEKTSAFDMLKLLGVHCITEPYSDEPFGFIPWHPLRTAEEMTRELGKCETIFYHGDVDLRSDPHNLIPTKLLSELGVTTVYTGHDHLPRIEVRDGVTINVVGSMQPYSHSEDPDELLYVTRDLATVRDNPGHYLDKCLRIELAPGEKLDFDVDCLQLTLKKAGVEDTDISVQMDEFNLDRLLEESLVDIDESIGALVRDKYQELRSR